MLPTDSVRPPAMDPRTVLLTRISAYIDRHLGDPDLGPAAIAAHHHLSVRALHLLFRGAPDTVAATIRRRRLEHCRADLADPAMSHRTIGETALRWGFRHQADFSRAFRRAYGTAPREIRPDAPKACTRCQRQASPSHGTVKPQQTGSNGEES
ncbi:helix-turn-helix transcriptional regulator [Streptomyces bambusae]|uniref:helix-turn-helix transcriptional regulator n=1 Tax=Streptomyces bambusae TaxID=1550616 RepID=UPI0035588AE1